MHCNIKVLYCCFYAKLIFLRKISKVGEKANLFFSIYSCRKLHPGTTAQSKTSLPMNSLRSRKSLRLFVFIPKARSQLFILVVVSRSRPPLIMRRAFFVAVLACMAGHTCRGLVAYFQAGRFFGGSSHGDGVAITRVGSGAWQNTVLSLGFSCSVLCSTVRSGQVETAQGSDGANRMFPDKSCRRRSKC